jgi:hypothetical protein
MGLKGKIKGSYLYTQWKLGKYTKRRVKHSNIVNYDYEDEEPNYPVSSNSYPAYHPSGNSENHYHNKETSNQGVSQDDNFYHPQTYNRMAYYPTMDENEENYDNQRQNY